MRKMKEKDKKKYISKLIYVFIIYFSLIYFCFVFLQKGQEAREKFGYKDGRQNPLCSKTNREKKKTKAFQMLKHKIKGKVKRSFKEKQIALRNHLLKQKRMK